MIPYPLFEDTTSFPVSNTHLRLLSPRCIQDNPFLPNCRLQSRDLSRLCPGTKARPGSRTSSAGSKFHAPSTCSQSPESGCGTSCAVLCGSVFCLPGQRARGGGISLQTWEVSLLVIIKPSVSTTLPGSGASPSQRARLSVSGHTRIVLERQTVTGKAAMRISHSRNWRGHPGFPRQSIDERAKGWVPQSLPSPQGLPRPQRISHLPVKQST